MNKLSITMAVAIAMVFISCNNKIRQPVVAGASKTVDTIQGSCAYLTHDSEGNPVLSWVRHASDSSAVLCYAISRDKGESFSPAAVIATSTNIHPHAENLPKIVFKPSGEIIAVWGADSPDSRNKYAGLVYYSVSVDKGKTWSEARRLVKDTGSHDQRYFDVSLMANGEVAIIWLDDRKTDGQPGSSLYFARTEGGTDFQHEKRICESTCECCRVDLYADSKNNIHTIFRGIISDSIRDILHSVSSDGGKTFSPAKPISNDNWVIRGCPHTGPSMVETDEGMHFSWYTMGNGSGIFYTGSDLKGNEFKKKDSICGKSGRHPQLASLGKSRIGLVWDENMESGERPITRIALETRIAGKSENKTYVSPDSATATYPVIQLIPNTSSAIVAFTVKDADKKMIQYVKVDL